MTWIFGIFRRERTACGQFTPTTWRCLSRRCPRRRRRMRSATRLASLWPLSPPSTRSSSTSRPSLTFHGRLFVWLFLLAKVQFPFIGVDFLRHFKLLVDPAANRLVDTISTQLLPTVSSVRSQPEPAESSAMAAATPVGRSADSQVHAREAVPAFQSGCSQSGQPARAVTAAVRRLPPPQPGHRAGHLPSAQHAGFFC